MDAYLLKWRPSSCWMGSLDMEYKQTGKKAVSNTSPSLESRRSLTSKQTGSCGWHTAQGSCRMRRSNSRGSIWDFVQQSAKRQGRGTGKGRQVHAYSLCVRVRMRVCLSVCGLWTAGPL